MPGKYELTFEISDSGIGITKKNLAALFQSFAQVSTQMHR